MGVKTSLKGFSFSTLFLRGDEWPCGHLGLRHAVSAPGCGGAEGEAGEFSQEKGFPKEKGLLLTFKYSSIGCLPQIFFGWVGMLVLS